MLPTDIYRYILDLLEPAYYNRSTTKEYRKLLENISLASRRFHQLSVPKLKVVKRIYQLVFRYHLSSVYTAKSLLINQCFTGCNLPFAEHSVDKFDETVEQDIRDTIRLIPSTLNYNGGTLRCRYHITPLAAACFNKKIPVNVVEILLQAGASPNTIIKVNGSEVPLLYDLKNNICADRYTSVKKLFVKYGFKK